jgi:hypothetical protein
VSISIPPKSGPFVIPYWLLACSTEQKQERCAHYDCCKPINMSTALRSLRRSATTKKIADSCEGEHAQSGERLACKLEEGVREPLASLFLD